MLITPNIFNNNQYQFQNKTNFKGMMLSHKAQSVGQLRSSTREKISFLTHIYNQIVTDLKSISNEGLSLIQKEIPVLLKEGLIFNNCGKNNTSIMLRGANSDKYNGLLRIIERKGQSVYATNVNLNSFMLKGNDLLVKNFDKNRSKQFPDTQEYMTMSEIQDGNYEEILDRICQDLDVPMLNLRKCISKVKSEYGTIPDGKLNYKIVDLLKQTDVLFEEFNSLRQKIPHKRLLEMKHNFPNLLMITGAKKPLFKNVNNDAEIINFAPVTSSRDDNMKRLVIYDKDFKLKKHFLIVDDNKLVSNLNPLNETQIPDKFVYYNATDLLKDENEPELYKYLVLYKNKLSSYVEYCKKEYANLKYAPTPKEFSYDITDALSNIKKQCDTVKRLYKKIPIEIAESLFKKEEAVYRAGRIGIKTLSKNKSDTVTFIPLKSKKHSDLIRVDISNANSGINQHYLIHKNKFVVKNYNPKYPTIIPNVLLYMNETGLNESGLSELVRSYSSKLSVLTEKMHALANDERILTVKPSKKYGISKETKANKNFQVKSDSVELNQHKQSTKRSITDSFDFLLGQTDSLNLDKEQKQMLTDSIKKYEQSRENFNKAQEELNNSLLTIKNLINSFFISKVK